MPDIAILLIGIGGSLGGVALGWGLPFLTERSRQGHVRKESLRRAMTTLLFLRMRITRVSNVFHAAGEQADMEGTVRDGLRQLVVVDEKRRSESMAEDLDEAANLLAGISPEHAILFRQARHDFEVLIHFDLDAEGAELEQYSILVLGMRQLCEQIQKLIEKVIKELAREAGEEAEITEKLLKRTKRSLPAGSALESIRQWQSEV